MTVPPSVKGWCPGAFKPMMSGDGLVVRVRPRFARLEPEQVLGLSALAISYGSGFLDLTNRGNLQIRGVSETNHNALLAGLAELDLLDEDPSIESRRNILIAPLWREGNVTHRIAAALLRALPELPDLSAKFGFAIDTGPDPRLQKDSADIRVEWSDQGLIVRADGAARGRLVAEPDVIPTVLTLAQWFDTHRTKDRRRMAKVLEVTDLPEGWEQAAPREQGAALAVGPCQNGAFSGATLGAPFGQIDAAELAALMAKSNARALRVTPWRLFILEGVGMPDTDAFVTDPSDPLLHTDACPGAPYCTSSSVETRDFARAVAAQTKGSVHVSGCEKGCANARTADTTYVGHDGRFDLVKNGAAWDAPVKTGLRPDDILAKRT
ncbi:MAG: cobalamin biosynthesis protein CobG [Pelagimonas sp.]|nr:cobalamin biosynthesis protein CobG [Pelagimonas sp.]